MVFKGYRVTSDYGWRIHPIEQVPEFYREAVKNTLERND